MRSRFILIVILFLILSATVSATDLYQVSIYNQADAEALSRVGGDVLLSIENGYLVLGESDFAERLGRESLGYELVAADISRDELVLDNRLDSYNVGRFPLVFEQGGVRLFRVPSSEIFNTPEATGLAPILTKDIDVRFNQPPRLSSWDRAAAAVDLDSLVGLVSQDSVESYLYRLQAFYRRMAATDSNAAARDWLVGKFHEFGYDSVVVQPFPANLWGVPAICENVIAVKPGTDLWRHQIVIGAHRDAVPSSPGADDNGSGTTGVLEIARVLKDIDTRMTIIFVLFDAEEEGLWGSYYYSNLARSSGDNIVLMLNMDMIGHYENDTEANLWFAGEDTFAQIWANLADSLSGINITQTYFPGQSGGSDHYPFAQNGYHALFVQERIFSNVYHTFRDSTSYINFDYMTRMIMTTAATAYQVDAGYIAEPELLVSYPTGVPDILMPGNPGTFDVLVEEYAGGVVVSDSVLLHYAVDDEPYVSATIPAVGGGLYTAPLPDLPCETRLKFFVSADEASGSRFYAPDQNNPFAVGSATHLDVAFEDDFQNYLGWSVQGNATEGLWIRREPSGGGTDGDPFSDYDGSGMCYVTGNDPGEDVSGGVTILRSPLFDASGGDALVSYARWCYSSSSLSEYFAVYISNNDGGRWYEVDMVNAADMDGGWETRSFWVSDFVTPSSQMRLRFDAADASAGSTVEAAVDAVSITSYWCEPPPEVTTVALPNWTEGIAYDFQLQSSGGYGVVTFSDKYDDLTPADFNLSSLGQLTGMPIGAGIISFTTAVVDEIGREGEKPFSIVINPMPAITTETLPEATEGEVYSHQLLSTGGTAELLWTDKHSDLSGSGLQLTTGGIVEGIPAVVDDIIFTALITDAAGATVEKPLVLTVNVAYVCGDIDGDQAAPNISDVTYFVDYMFGGGPPPPMENAADVDGSGVVDISDLTYYASFLFGGGPDPECE